MELFDKIYQMRRSFYMESKMKPNVVYMDIDKLMALKSNYVNYLSIPYDQTKPITAFGMDIKIVEDDDYLSVGFVMEDKKAPLIEE